MTNIPLISKNLIVTGTPVVSTEGSDLDEKIRQLEYF